MCFQWGTLKTSWSVVAKPLLSAVTRPLLLVKAITAAPGTTTQAEQSQKPSSNCDQCDQDDTALKADCQPHPNLKPKSISTTKFWSTQSL